MNIHNSPPDKYLPSFLLSSSPKKSTPPSFDSPWSPYSYQKTSSFSVNATNSPVRTRQRSDDYGDYGYGSPSGKSIGYDDLPPVNSLFDLANPMNTNGGVNPNNVNNSIPNSDFTWKPQQPDDSFLSRPGPSTIKSSHSSNLRSIQPTATSSLSAALSQSTSSSSSSGSKLYTISVIGFPPSDRDYVYSLFSSIGAIVSSDIPVGKNYMKLRFAKRREAEEAKKLHRFELEFGRLIVEEIFDDDDEGKMEVNGNSNGRVDDLVREIKSEKPLVMERKSELTKGLRNSNNDRIIRGAAVTNKSKRRLSVSSDVDVPRRSAKSSRTTYKLKDNDDDVTKSSFSSWWTLISELLFGW